MTLTEIRTRVQRQFGDTSGAQITTDDIDRWANDAQVDIVRRTEVLQKEATPIDVVLNTDSYSLPADFMFARRVTYEGLILKRTTIEELDKYAGDRDDIIPTGTADRYYIWGDLIHLYPTPDRSITAGLIIQYVYRPIALSGGADIPEIPIHMHEDIVRFAVARAKELNEDDRSSQIIMSDYENRMSKAREESFHPYVDSYPSVRLIPGDDW